MQGLHGRNVWLGIAAKAHDQHMHLQRQHILRRPKWHTSLSLAFAPNSRSSNGQLLWSQNLMIGAAIAARLRELAGLTDRELNDIGISRAEIPAVARGDRAPIVR